MKKPTQIVLILFLLSSLLPLSTAQSLDNLEHIEGASINLYHSKGFEMHAHFIKELCEEANAYYSKALEPLDIAFDIVVLSESDWPKYIHTQLIYGMPHFTPDGNKLVVSAEDNAFWRSQLPDLSALESPYKELFPAVYQVDGAISNRYFFDLLCIHELGHVWAAHGERNSQRLWLEELFCNLMLHTFIAEERGEFLPALTILPMYWANTDATDLPFTTLQQFESDYYKIGREAPHNYGWYQFRFHFAAKNLYDQGGPEVLRNLWDFMGNYQEKFSDEELLQKLESEVHPHFRTLLESW